MREESATPLFAEERKEEILNLLEVQGKLTVPELSAHFGVSAVTIRNDLRDLEASGKLTRAHGGAISNHKASYEAKSIEKEIAHVNEKVRIAKKAASMIDDFDTIALDSGSTTFELAKCLSRKQGLTIVTNDIQTALCLEQSESDFSIVVIGGALRTGFHCTLGPLAENFLQGLNIDKAFLATNGFSPYLGLTTPNSLQAELKKQLILISKEVILLADASKYDEAYFVKFGDITNIHGLITDHSLPDNAAAEMLEINSSLKLYRV